MQWPVDRQSLNAKFVGQFSGGWISRSPTRFAYRMLLRSRLLVFIGNTELHRKNRFRCHPMPPNAMVHGGERGIRTLDTPFWAYAPLAGECLRPLGHVSGKFFDSTGAERARSNAQAPASLRYAASGVLSNPNARCSTRTASSRYFSSTTTEILISDVEIIWMLIASSA